MSFFIILLRYYEFDVLNEKLKEHIQGFSNSYSILHKYNEFEHALQQLLSIEDNPPRFMSKIFSIVSTSGLNVYVCDDKDQNDMFALYEKLLPMCIMLKDLALVRHIKMFNEIEGINDISIYDDGSKKGETCKIIHEIFHELDQRYGVIKTNDSKQKAQYIIANFLQTRLSKPSFKDEIIKSLKFDIYYVDTQESIYTDIFNKN
jgi:hypothetical protein